MSPSTYEPSPASVASASARVFPWGRLVLALLALAVASLVVYCNVRPSDVHFVSGFDQSVEVVLEHGGESDVFVVETYSSVERTLAGEVRITVRVPETGEVLDIETVTIPRATDFVAYNLVGSTPLVLEELIYDRGIGGTGDYEYFAGQRLIVGERVDYIFESPPDTIYTSSGEESRWQLRYSGEGRWTDSVDHLLGEGELEAAQRIVAAALRLEPDNWDAADFARRVGLPASVAR